MDIPDAIPILELYDISGFTDKYCATKDGRIYSLLSNKFLTQSDDTYGYNTVNMSDRTYKVHRIIASTFLDNPLNHPHVDHLNRNRKDNRLCNLRFASLSENQNNKNPRVKRPLDMRGIVVKNTTFKVSVLVKGKRMYKSFKTLEEAKAYRDELKTTVS
jgi:hypothetical protein